MKVNIIINLKTVVTMVILVRGEKTFNLQIIAKLTIKHDFLH